MTLLTPTTDIFPDSRRVAPLRRPFSVDDYHRMAEVGLLREDERTELLYGEVLCKMPIGSRHAGCVKWLLRQLSAALGERAVIGAQDPVRLDPFSEPEPDISVLRPRDDLYRGAHPGPADLQLVIEVADSSLYLDRQVKAPLYAAAGVPELWLVDLRTEGVEVHREPRPGGYATSQRFGRGELLSPLAFPDVQLSVSELLGPAD